MKTKTLIGKAEYCWLVQSGIKKVPARIDTGARTSSIWASDIKETESGLQYVLFGKTSPLYTGTVLTAHHFSKIIVASSNGQTEERYKIMMTLQIRGRRIRTYFTLDRKSTRLNSSH